MPGRPGCVRLIQERRSILTRRQASALVVSSMAATACVESQPPWRALNRNCSSTVTMGNVWFILAAPGLFCSKDAREDARAPLGAVPDPTPGPSYFLKRFSKAWRASVWRGGAAEGVEPGAAG